MIQDYEIRKSPYYTGIGLGNIDFSSEISNGPQQKGWNKENSPRSESHDKGSRSKWAVKSSSSSRRYGPVGYGSGRRYGSVPALHSPTLVGPVTDF